MPRKALKLCCCAAAIVVVILIVTFVILYFTVLKPKSLEVVATPVNLQHIEFVLLPAVELHLTIGMDIDVHNPNYDGFKYGNSTTMVYYRGGLVAEAPIPAGSIKARSTENVSSSVDIFVEELVANQSFLPDVFSGLLHLTTVSSMEGKVVLLRMFKLKAKTSVSCDMATYLRSRNSSSSCDSKIKF